jgi:putative endonuclease
MNLFWLIRPMDQSWRVYMIQSDKDGSIYTGISINIERRISQHNDGTGAKRTRGRGPWKLLWTSQYMSHVAAARLEYTIKKLSRAEKLKWIES